MTCRKCGSDLAADSSYCSKCKKCTPNHKAVTISGFTKTQRDKELNRLRLKYESRGWRFTEYKDQFLGGKAYFYLPDNAMTWHVCRWCLIWFGVGVILLLPFVVNSPDQARMQSTPISTQKPGPITFASKPVAVSTDAKQLPPRFSGSDPMAAATQLENIAAQLPIDKYTTDVEKQKYVKAASEKVSSLNIVYKCYSDYDPKHQRFNFSIQPKDPSTGLGLYEHLGADVAVLTIYEDRKLLGTYTASNAFGVTKPVTRRSQTQVELAYRTKSFLGKPGNEPRSIVTKDSYRTEYKFTIGMPPAEARSTHSDIQCLILFKPAYPFVVRYDRDIAPTISFPEDIEVSGTALIGKFEQLWVFNQRTGHIYAKFK